VCTLSGPPRRGFISARDLDRCRAGNVIYCVSALLYCSGGDDERETRFLRVITVAGELFIRDSFFRKLRPSPPVVVDRQRPPKHRQRRGKNGPGDEKRRASRGGDGSHISSCPARPFSFSGTIRGRAAGRLHRGE